MGFRFYAGDAKLLAAGANEKAPGLTTVVAGVQVTLCPPVPKTCTEDPAPPVGCGERNRRSHRGCLCYRPDSYGGTLRYLTPRCKLSVRVSEAAPAGLVLGFAGLGLDPAPLSERQRSSGKRSRMRLPELFLCGLVAPDSGINTRRASAL